MKTIKTAIYTVKFFIVTLMLSLASQANASLINIGGNQASPLLLSESFTDFYNFANGTPWSANTGLEQANTMTAFLASYMDDTALFLIFSGPGGDAGGVNFDINGTGSIAFIDDPARKGRDGTITQRDPINGNNVSMNYVAGYTDGLIYSGLNTDDWYVDININSSYGLDAFRFLSFDENGNDSVLYSSSSALGKLPISSLQINVSAPFISMLTIFGFAYLVYRRR